MNAEWLRKSSRCKFALAGLKQADEPARLLTASRTFRTREQGLFSIR